jgi:hypothetical protein
MARNLPAMVVAMELEFKLIYEQISIWRSIAAARAITDVERAAWSADIDRADFLATYLTAYRTGNLELAPTVEEIVATAKADGWLK